MSFWLLCRPSVYVCPFHLELVTGQSHFWLSSRLSLLTLNGSRVGTSPASQLTKWDRLEHSVSRPMMWRQWATRRLQHCSVRPSNNKADFFLNGKLWWKQCTHMHLYDASSYSLLHTAIFQDTVRTSKSILFHILFNSFNVHKTTGLLNALAILVRTHWASSAQSATRATVLRSPFSVRRYEAASTQLCKYTADASGVNWGNYIETHYVHWWKKKTFLVRSANRFCRSLRA